MKRIISILLALTLTSALALAQTKKVTGTVKDATGEPLIGVTVMVPGKASTGTITDFDGNYTISINPKDKLLFSYVGFSSQTLEPKGDKLDVVMKEDAAQLEEVVVVGFGQTKKESLTGAVSTVSAKQFEDKGGITSPLEAMQGQVAGVIITRGSSAPGGDWNLSLRGSVSANNVEPLVIIDGVASTVSDMNTLNPDDIESMNFLKDGSAAIYGSRAAGGVVIIVTKKGKEGQLKLDYNVSATVKHPGLQPQLMNIDQWSTGLKQMLTNDGLTSDVWYTYADMMQKYKGQYMLVRRGQGEAFPFPDSAFSNVKDFSFYDTDWLGSLFGNGHSMTHDLALSGGTDKNAFRLSLGYNYDGSTLQYGNNNNKRFTFRLSDTYKLRKNLKLESNIAYTRNEKVVPTFVNSAISSGSLPQPGLPLRALNGKAYAWGTWGSPIAKIEEGGDNTTSSSTINISETLNWDITDWLTANGNFGYRSSRSLNNVVSNTIQFYDIEGLVPISGVTDVPTQETTSYKETTSQTDFYSVSGYLNGHKSFKDHNLSLTLGSQYEFTDVSGFGALAKNIQQGIEVINGSGDITLTGTSRKQSSILSYFTRFNYDWKSRYLFEFNGRYDGSSKFLPANRWDFFWGVSLGWRVGEEKWFKDIKWLTNLKLRASYAEVGNQNGIGEYDGIQLYNTYSNSGAYVGDSRLSYITTSGTLASQTRTWERIKNYNVALDFGVELAPGHNINGTLEWFLKQNDNMLVSVKYPGVLGIGAPTANAGEFHDWGWEGQVTYNGKIGQVSYHVGGTLTFARNELVNFKGTIVRKNGLNSNVVGYSHNAIFGYRYAGKIKDEEQLRSYIGKYYANNGISMPNTLRVGDNMYSDENGDGVLDEKDMIYLGSTTPELSYSFNIGATWKGIDINLVFQGAGNRFIYRGINNLTVPFRNKYSSFTTNSLGNTAYAVDGILMNPDAYYAPYTSVSAINSYNYMASSLTVQDGRYLRLKNLTIGYTFPKKLLKKIGFIKNLHVYYTGTDLWEWTKITDGWDPESDYTDSDGSGTNLYPFTRNHTFGMNITF